MNGIPLAVNVTKTKKCERCTKRYKLIFDECPHCKDIQDGRDLEEYIDSYKNELKANARLGLVFLGVTIILVALLIIGLVAR